MERRVKKKKREPRTMPAMAPGGREEDDFLATEGVKVMAASGLADNVPVSSTSTGIILGMEDSEELIGCRIEVMVVASGSRISALFDVVAKREPTVGELIVCDGVGVDDLHSGLQIPSAKSDKSFSFFFDELIHS